MIELVVTLTILGLILAVSIPGVGSWLKNNQVRNAAESIQNGIQRARSEALRRNEQVTFWLVSTGTAPVGALVSTCALSSTSASWVVSLDDPAGKCTDSASETTAPRIVESHGQADGAPAVTSAALQSDGTAATSLTFNGFGRVVGTTGIAQVNIKYGSDSRELRIVVSNGGSVRMCDVGVSDSTDPRKCPA